MKTYDRKLKKWVEEEKPMTSLKRPETCKGKKPHEFVLLIPPMYSKHREFSFEEVARYYEIEEGRQLLEKSYNEEMAQLGLDSRHWSYKVRKFYKCVKCGKERYE